TVFDGVVDFAAPDDFTVFTVFDGVVDFAAPDDFTVFVPLADFAAPDDFTGFTVFAALAGFLCFADLPEPASPPPGASASTSTSRPRVGLLAFGVSSPPQMSSDVVGAGGRRFGRCGTPSSPPRSSQLVRSDISLPPP
ncbi:MAG: hypothetical protein QNM02_19470, partial [Acidimicrobiia bacterium]|nr:hypothetical protein [Acidimicrobiia bacterium]